MSPAGLAQGEVPRGDRRREPVVEGLGQVQARMHASPSRAAAPTRAPAACGRGTGHSMLDLAKCALAQLLELLARYSCTCHGLSERAAPFGASVSTLAWTGTRPPPGRPRSERKCSSALPGSARCSIVCRNTTASAGSREGVHQVALEAQVRRPVAQACMLVGLGVGVDADDAGGSAGKHVRAITLPAGHVDHSQTRYLRGDPFVDDEMAAKPVVLGGHVGSVRSPVSSSGGTPWGWSALYVEVGRLTPRARYSGRLVGHGRPMYGPHDEIRDVNTRYHDVAAATTTPSGASTSATSGKTR